MKTAIVIVGHTRTFDRCLPTQHWNVYRYHPDADFFVSTVKDADSHKVDLLGAKYGHDRVRVDMVDSQPDCVSEMRGLGVNLPAEWHRGQPYTHEPYAISVHPQAVLRQLWQLNRAWTAFPELASYDCVIRTRPDLWFQSQCKGVAQSVGMPPTDTALALFASSMARVPNWGSFGGVNDRFAVLSRPAAAAYFTTYAKIPALIADGCPIHPESLVAASMEAAGVLILRNLAVMFATLRGNGEFRQPEITSADLMMC